MEFILTIIIFLISIPVGEYFGRSKHIGKWWTVVLMTCGIIPGIIALIFSPKATKEPTKGIIYEVAGWFFFLIIGVFGILLTFFDLFSYLENYNDVPNYLTQSIGIRLIIGIWGIIIGVYLIKLGNGKIVNNNPKIYFTDNIKGANVLFEKLNQNPLSKKFESKYYIVKDNNPIGPFLIKELESMQIKEDDLVCLNGSKQWVKASEIRELKAIIIFNPPPLPVKKEEEDQIELDKPAIPPRIIKYEKVFDQNELVVYMNGLTIGIGDQVYDGGVLAEGHFILPNGVEIDCKDGVIVQYKQNGNIFYTIINDKNIKYWYINPKIWYYTKLTIKIIVIGLILIYLILTIDNLCRYGTFGV